MPTLHAASGRSCVLGPSRLHPVPTRLRDERVPRPMHTTRSFAKLSDRAALLVIHREAAPAATAAPLYPCRALLFMLLGLVKKASTFGQKGKHLGPASRPRPIDPFPMSPSPLAVLPLPLPSSPPHVDAPLACRACSKPHALGSCPSARELGGRTQRSVPRHTGFTRDQRAHVARCLSGGYVHNPQSLLRRCSCHVHRCRRGGFTPGTIPSTRHHPVTTLAAPLFHALPSTFPC